jgi:spermidine/putrescine transport system ATP-binding protein
MVFQNYALFPHMSVFDNVAFGLSVRRTPSKEIARRVETILELVQLPGYATRRPRELSGGQQQRVALARALVLHPRVLLLDEPLGALDKRLRQHMQIELKQIQREVGITTVFVTHDQEEALTLSDRVAIISRGRVVQVGTPDEVYERPRTAFAAEFLGAANFLEGRVARRRGQLGCVVLASGAEILTTQRLPADGAAVVLAVRPEKFTIHSDSVPLQGGVEPVNQLEGRIRQPVYMGSSITYRVEVAGGEFTIFRQNVDARTYAPGQPVWLSWPPAHSIVLEGLEPRCRA